MQLNSTPYSPVPKSFHKFAGIQTTEQAQQNFLFGPEVEDLLKSDNSPYIGELPQQIATALNVSSQTLLEKLDKLAAHLQDFDLNKFTSGKPNCPDLPWKHTGLAFNVPVFNILINNHIVKISTLGYGTDGFAFKLSIPHNNHQPEQHFAFKVYYPDRPNWPRKGIYAESARGLYATSTGITKDLAKFYVANPTSGWLLSEFIDSSDSIGKRPGHLLASKDIRFFDDSLSDNRISGIRLDYGTMTKNDDETTRLKKRPWAQNNLKSIQELMNNMPEEVKSVQSLDIFMSLLQAKPLLRPSLFIHIQNMPANSRLAAFKNALNYTDIHPYITIQFLSNKDRLTGLIEMLKFSPLKLAAARQFPLIPFSDREKALTELKKHPELFAFRIFHEETNLFPAWLKTRLPGFNPTLASATTF